MKISRDQGQRDMGSLSTKARQSLSLMIIAWAIIIVVAAYDNFETVKNHAVLVEMEQNPVACWVLEQCNHGVAVVVAWKTLGLGLGVFLAAWVWKSPKYRKQIVLASCFVAVTQVYVMYFLTSDYSWREDVNSLTMHHDGIDAAAEVFNTNLKPGY